MEELSDGHATSVTMDTGAPAMGSSASSRGVTNAAVDKAGITMATASHVLMITARHALSSGHSAINAKMDMSQTAMVSASRMILAAVERVWTTMATALIALMRTANNAAHCGLNAPSASLDSV